MLQSQHSSLTEIPVHVRQLNVFKSGLKHPDFSFASQSGVALLLTPLQHNLDPTLKDLIESLLCDVEERLGSHGGAEEIKVKP